MERKAASGPDPLGWCWDPKGGGAPEKAGSGQNPVECLVLWFPHCFLQGLPVDLPQGTWWRWGGSGERSFGSLASIQWKQLSF